MSNLRGITWLFNQFKYSIIIFAYTTQTVSGWIAYGCTGNNS